MVVVLERHEAERLQNAVSRLPHHGEELGHPVHRARLRLKRNFDEVALAERLGHVQQAAGRRDGLEFRFCAPAIFQANRS